MAQGELKLVESMDELTPGVRVVFKACEYCEGRDHEGIVVEVGERRGFIGAPLAPNGPVTMRVVKVLPLPACGCSGYTEISVQRRRLYRRVDFDPESAIEQADIVEHANAKLESTLRVLERRALERTRR